MVQSIFENPNFLKVEDLFDSLMDTDPEETARLAKSKLKKEADRTINKLLQFLEERIAQFRCGDITSSDLCCEMYRLSALVNDEVYVYVES